MQNYLNLAAKKPI